MKNVDLVVIGGGPAGMAAALSAREKGISDILIAGKGNHSVRLRRYRPDYGKTYDAAGRKSENGCGNHALFGRP